MLLKRKTKSNSFILTAVGLTYDDSHLLSPVQSAEEQGLVKKLLSHQHIW